MADIIAKIISSVLIALYQPFWFAVLLTFLVMALYLDVKKYRGIKAEAKIIAGRWKKAFLNDSTFRWITFFVFYTTMILFRTLLNRNMWANPVSDVMGGWWLYDKDGKLTTEPIENLMLFIPFSTLLLWAVKDKVLKGNAAFKNILWQSTKIVFLFSLTIEFLQLFLRLGTFQLSDIFYNTVGGTIGGLIYWIWYKVKGYKEEAAAVEEAAGEKLDYPQLISLTHNTDFRGYTAILYDRSVSEKLNFNLVQVNQGYSKLAFTLRGLHFQESPHEQAKLVQVLSGSIYNVAVDIRTESSTFGVYYAEELKAGDNKAVYIPRGFAHGYLTLEDNTLVQWCVDNDFCGEAARCLRFDDREIRSMDGEHGIQWPCEREKIILSEKDKNGLF